MKRILVVDDAKVVVSLIRVYFANWPVEFIVAGDGEAGLVMAKEHKPDLVIADVRMPKMDGFELCGAIIADERLAGVPVVLLSANADEAARKKGELVGATAFLKKPVSPEELKATVGKILGIGES